jgi:hypothetical protein
MEQITNIQEISPITFELQTYSPEVTNLVTSVEINTQFNPETDYVEYFIYDLNNDIVFANNFGFPNYSLLDNQLSIDPEKDIIDTGFDKGEYNTLYNFFSTQLGSNGSTLYYISEISTNRTEIRLNSTNLTNEEIVTFATEFINQQQSSSLAYPDFYLNFGYNQLIIANNILLDNSDINNATILIKLYEPLPDDFYINRTLWVVEKVAESKAYNINNNVIFNNTDGNIYLKGPNTNLGIKDQINNSTEYGSYSSLSNTQFSQGSGSLQYQINSLLAEKGIEINIDYSDYSQFINFSSAQTRLENFYYKLSLIETYSNNANLSDNTATNYYVSSSNVSYQLKIDDIITNFDGYEYYLYYDSGSNSWPKTNSTYPYVNATTTSTLGQNFLVSQSAVAEYFDNENNNSLVGTIPSYLSEDEANAPYELFVEMVGQSFDSIWVYLKDITNKFDADNRLNYGISKDLIAQAIRDLGVNIYQNNFSSGDLYSALLGVTPLGSLFNLPNTTGSLPTPAGYEYIDNYVTTTEIGGPFDGSFGIGFLRLSQTPYPVDDINKSIYKRIYHNLPYLLKKKGTVEGLRTLISIYGIPDTILRINEFGGKDKNNSNDWDFWYNQFDYQYDTNDDGIIQSNWEINPLWNSEDDRPQTVEFRFKTPGLESALSRNTQSLWSLDSDVRIDLEYTGSGYTSGSYSGSIPDPENEYATLKFITNNESASIYLPFYDGGWWSVAVTRDGDNFNLFAGNNIYTGEEGSSIGFTGSATLNSSATEWVNGTYSDLSPISINDKFSGSFQELRFYNTPILRSVFDDYVMNYNSIEGNTTNSSAYEVVFRASLGGELYTGSVSIHPKSTGSLSFITSSFPSGNIFDITNGEFISKEEYVYFDQFPAGIKNRNSNKIKQSQIILPYTSSVLNNIPNNQVLSPFTRVQQNSYVSESYTNDLDYVEVAFSPQNEINDDIIDSIGYFNIGDYIGDPRQVSSSSEIYPQLNTLRDEYFSKYKNEYNIFDYVRLIKYLDNSLFKMLKDWVPARTSLASGVVVKQHLLERNKYPVPQVTSSNDIYTASIEIGEYSAGNGGSMPNLEGEISGSGPGFNIVPITQSWTGSTPSLLGQVEFINNDQHEFYDGELSGSEFIVTNGELNPGCDPLKSVNTDVLLYNVEAFAYNNDGDLSSNPKQYPFEIFVSQITLNTATDALLSSITVNPNDQTNGNYTVGLTTITGNGVDATALVTVSSNIVTSITIPSNFTGDNEYAVGDELRIDAGELGGSAVTIILQEDDFAPNSGLGTDGDITLWWNATFVGAGEIKTNAWDYSIEAVKIFKISSNGIDNSNYLGQLTNIDVDTNTWTIFSFGSDFLSTTTKNIRCKVLGIAEYPDFFLYYVAPFGNIRLESNSGSPNGISISGQSNISTALTPYVLSSFNVSDCNVVLNNAPLNRISNRYYDVDYSSNAVTAVNEEAILNGTAPKAEVQNSNYTSFRQISPRYLGTKNTSPALNKTTNNGLPSIEHTTPYFLYSPGGNYNTIADRSGSGLYFIGFMVDELGNTYEPQESESAYLPNLYSGFGKDSKVTFVSTNTESDVVGTFSVYAPATKIKPIIYSDKGSLGNNYMIPGTYTTMSFIPDPNETDQFLLNVTNNTFIVNAGNTVRYEPDIIFTDQASGWGDDIIGNLQYFISQSSNINGTIDLLLECNNTIQPMTATLNLYKSGSATPIQTNTIIRSTTGDFDLTISKSIPIIEGDAYYVRITALTEDLTINGYTGGASIYSSFKLTPNISTNSVLTSGSWTTGQTIDNVLTASQDLASSYGYVQANVSGSGFQYPLLFNLKQYDQIRYNGKESRVFEIGKIEYNVDVTVNPTKYNLYVYLSKPVNTTIVDLDYYVFRRNEFQKNTIIVDGPGAVMQAGFILPEYQSPLLKENLSSIVQNLTNNGLISTN